MCDNGRCMNYRARCDGVKQCRDGRDEANCRMYCFFLQRLNVAGCNFTGPFS